MLFMSSLFAFSFHLIVQWIQGWKGERIIFNIIQSVYIYHTEVLEWDVGGNAGISQ